MIGKQISHIAIDEKTSRGSRDDANGFLALHTVILWNSDTGLVLAQCKMSKKSNEITAIPELLAILDLRGTTVTIDRWAVNATLQSLSQIAGGNDLLAVKANQPTLAIELKETVDDIGNVREPGAYSGPEYQFISESEKGHGRIETRTIRLCRDLRWVLSAKRWESLSTLVEVTRERLNVSSEKNH